MVEDGWAWHFKKYSDDQNLAALEQEAREAKRGLWAANNPIPPWEFRDKKSDVPVVAAPIAKPVEKPVAKPEPAPQPTKKYWLNTKSNVRHNDGCKHYGSTKSGRSCGPDDGKACGICGG